MNTILGNLTNNIHRKIHSVGQSKDAGLLSFSTLCTPVLAVLTTISGGHFSLLFIHQTLIARKTFRICSKPITSQSSFLVIFNIIHGLINEIADRLVV